MLGKFKSADQTLDLFDFYASFSDDVSLCVCSGRHFSDNELGMAVSDSICSVRAVSVSKASHLSTTVSCCALK